MQLSAGGELHPPQLPPQPSSPQAFPAQLGLHPWHCAPEQPLGQFVSVYA
jgi:hypothetical protein